MGFTHVAAGWNHSVAIKADGSIVAWGNNRYGQLNKIPMGIGFRRAAAGEYSSLVLGSVSAGDFTPFGVGCKGSAGVPQLAAVTQPIYGKTFTTMLSGLQTAAAPFIAVGMSNQQWGAIKLPLDLGILGLPGCKLLVGADVTLPLRNSAGSARFDLAIPGKNPWLLGKNLYLQGLALDLKANPLGVALSNAGKATIGL